MILAGIVAGGTGTRMQSALPKQFLPLAGEPILLHTLRTFLSVSEIDGIVVGVPADWVNYTKELLAAHEELKGEKRLYVCVGGSNRNETLACLMACGEAQFGIGDGDIFVTHDAVRPFVTEEMIRDSIRALSGVRACSAAIPATDTILCAMDGTHVSEVPRRDSLYQVQTPQTVYFGEFRSILASLSKEELGAFTDICSIYRGKGLPVSIIPGSGENIKITGPTDLMIGEAILRRRKEKEHV